MPGSFRGVSLNLKTRIEEQRTGTDKGPGGKLLRKILPIYLVKTGLMADVEAQNLHVHRIIHRHGRLF